MSAWRDRRILDLLRIELPIVQAPMAGAQRAPLAIAVARAGGLGSLPCAMLGADAIEQDIAAFRAAVPAPLNLNFFCHAPPPAGPAAEARWRRALEPYYREFGIAAGTAAPAAARKPFDSALCGLVERLRPEVVSFHFGLPEPALLERVKAVGAAVLASATTVAEAVWLELHGCDAIVAQGCEGGGHRGNFLSGDMATQPGTIALVPQIADAVGLPVIAAGGIGDARGIAAALLLGASAVQLGTAYLLCPEAAIAPVHRQALLDARDDSTALTNLFSGRPARGIVNRLMRELGPLSAEAPPFPLAGVALAPLRAHAENLDSGDFQSLWSGQAAKLCRAMPAEVLTRLLADETLALLAEYRVD
jgi:nitronate monooxygenase